MPLACGSSELIGLNVGRCEPGWLFRQMRREEDPPGSHVPRSGEGTVQLHAGGSSRHGGGPGEPALFVNVEWGSV